MDVATLKRIQAIRIIKSSSPSGSRSAGRWRSSRWSSITAISRSSPLRRASSRPRSRATSRSASFIGVAIILASIVLTGIYVMRANSAIRRADQCDRQRRQDGRKK